MANTGKTTKSGCSTLHKGKHVESRRYDRERKTERLWKRPRGNSSSIKDVVDFEACLIIGYQNLKLQICATKLDFSQTVSVVSRLAIKICQNNETPSFNRCLQWLLKISTGTLLKRKQLTKIKLFPNISNKNRKSTLHVQCLTIANEHPLYLHSRNRKSCLWFVLNDTVRIVNGET